MIGKRRDLNPTDRVARAIWIASPNGAGAVEREWEGVVRNWPEAAKFYRTLAKAVIGEMHDIVSDMVTETNAPYRRPVDDLEPVTARGRRFAFQR